DGADIRQGGIMKDPGWPSLKLLVAAGIAAALTASAAHAQEFRGTVLGRITDPQGAPVPGVHVSVVNEKTKVAQPTVTETDGAYQVPFLIPGTYRIEAMLPQFNKFVRSGVTVAIGQKVTVN